LSIEVTPHLNTVAGQEIKEKKSLDRGDIVVVDNLPLTVDKQ
jgi:hypothetical protein